MCSWWWWCRLAVGNVEIIKALLDNGARLNARDHQYMSAYNYAVECENHEAVRYLKAINADTRGPEHFSHLYQRRRRELDEDERDTSEMNDVIRKRKEQEEAYEKIFK